MAGRRAEDPDPDEAGSQPDWSAEQLGRRLRELRTERGLKKDVVFWRDMFVRPDVWRFPLWLNVQDFFEPLKIRRTYYPGHVFVRLDRAGEP